MGKLTKTLLILSIAALVVGMAFVIGLVNVENLVALYVVLPLGAVFLGLFLISLVLEKESALFDQEQRALLNPVTRRGGVLPLDSQKECCSSKQDGQSTLASAGAK